MQLACTGASVLDFFHASARDYAVVFTATATGALKLVGETYPFGPDGRLVLTADNQHAVHGIREFARARSTPTTYVPVVQPDLRIDTDALRAVLGCIVPGSQSLFAYPAQSNLSGVQHPLEWIELAKQRGWDVLLDAAAFVSTNRLDLTRWQPDFVPISFHELPGYSTGLGCLIARREALARLRRPRVSGGGLASASVSRAAHALNHDQPAFEDGTIDALGLAGVEMGLRYLRETGIDVVHARVQALTAWLLDQLTGLQHPNCAPLVRIYGPSTPESRGGTVSFNVLTRDGAVVDYHLVEDAAGACSTMLRPIFDRPLAVQEATRQRHEWGMLRASVSIATTPADISRFIEFIASFARGSSRATAYAA